MTTTADAGTTPPENTPPTLAMATSAPELKRENTLMILDEHALRDQAMGMGPESDFVYVDCEPCDDASMGTPQNTLMNMPPRNYVEMHNARVPCAPAITTGSRTLDRTLHLAPCRGCGAQDELLTIWYDNERETVCGACFAWACQAMRTIKVQRFYV